MHDGRWTMSRARPRRRRPSRGSSRSPSHRLGADPARASATSTARGRSSPASARRTIRCCSATWRVAVERIRAAIAAGTRICVHGDYDVDGICATALAVLTLRSLGADVEWHLPSRFEEGYGVSRETLARLAEEGFGLVLTVDCGITAVEEVAEARALGLEVIVTDHHRPGETLPDCPIVATRPSEYPFPELCGTGVVWKLAEALGAADRSTSTSSRSRRSPTSSRSSTRTARSRSPASARWRGRGSRGCGR